MNARRILMMDLRPEPCPAEDYPRLSTLIEQSLPGVEVRFESVGKPFSLTLPTRPDLVLFRPSSESSTSQIIRSIRRAWNHIPVLGLFDNDLRHMALSQGCAGDLNDFLFCPFTDVELKLRVRRLLEADSPHQQRPREVGVVAEGLRLESLVGHSPSFLRAVEKIPILAGCDATVLITGETGTGKDLFARGIHYHSARKSMPFIPVNCGALPDQLFENELFGHAKGAFTSAFSPQRGLVAEAEGGTLLLDEVETLSTAAQAKLLRFLQDRVYRPLGSSKSKVGNVRILAATNANLWNEVEGKRFREDLYYRLNVLSLSIPPLRDRMEDIPLLVAHFINEHRRPHGLVPSSLSGTAMQKLLTYSWPGNVRELEAAIQRSVLMCGSSIIQPDDIDLPVLDVMSACPVNSLREAKTSAVRDFERTYLVKTLIAFAGNISQAAKAAGKERRTFQRLLRKYGIDRQSFSRPS
ncbi:MAG TPA: sigma-54 dependent transcriptional regulator [Nitrospiraceae bacterium]|nr:sigma-54 dependent transcriptional regulator [Nitrospiraceae bacterium]